MPTIYDRDMALEYAMLYELTRQEDEEPWEFRVRVARFLEANRCDAQAYAALWNKPVEEWDGMSLERGYGEGFVEELARHVEEILASYRQQQARRVLKQQRDFLSLLRWLIATLKKDGKKKE